MAVRDFSIECSSRWAVEALRHPLDERFPEWGESPYYSATISGTKTLSELLAHLYVLIPVFDNEKHYFVGEDELEKLLAIGIEHLDPPRPHTGHLDFTTASNMLLERGKIAATPMLYWGKVNGDRFVRVAFNNEPASRLAPIVERARAGLKG